MLRRWWDWLMGRPELSIVQVYQRIWDADVIRDARVDGPAARNPWTKWAQRAEAYVKRRQTQREIA